MSLILEALRKSEAERRRGHTPDVAMELPPAPLRTRNATPAWLWPVVLAAIVVVAGAWWLAGRRDATEPSTPAIDAIATEITPPAMAPAVVPRAADPAPAMTATMPPPSTDTERDAVAAPVAVAPLPPPARELPPAPILPPPVPVPAATSMSGVKLSMHMWDASADKRFVILNGQRMAEGERNGDVQVIAIERDGVVVERDGQRARVPLP